jgi:ribose/xylose/arabinose/galactoside ABC-type transport system permease subunit
MVDLGKALVGLGLLLLVVGAGLILAGRLGWPIGRLPGDFAWKGKHVQVFFPLGTSIAISVVLTVAFWLLFKLRR